MLRNIFKSTLFKVIYMINFTADLFPFINVFIRFFFPQGVPKG